MRCCNTVISTDAAPDDDRIGYLRRMLLDHDGTDYRFEPAPDTPFNASMTFQQLGNIKLMEACGSMSKLARNANQESGSIEITFQLEGECIIRRDTQRTTDTRETTLKSGSFCIAPYQGQTEFEYPGSYRQAYINISAYHVAKHCHKWEVLTHKPISNSAGGVLTALIQGLLANGHGLSPLAAQEVFNATVAMLGAALEAEHAPAQPVQSYMANFHKERIRSYVLSHLNNQDMDIAMIARAVRLSPRYIHLLFADEAVHLSQWIWMQRLENCYRELSQNKNAKRPIGEIAYSWGFNDAAHFSRAFRKQFGLAPREVQKMADAVVSPEPDRASY